MAPMTERARRAPMPGWLWPVLLLALLALAVLLEGALPTGRLQVANPDRAAADAVDERFASLPDDALVLVAMDPDLGTYPEIRPTVRAVLDALLERGARLAVVSFTAEGRAVGAAELARLRDAGAPDDRLLDLGFIAGAEAGLVLSVTALEPVAGEDVPPAFAEVRGGIAAVDLAVLVGGVDIGPRTWVEQVATRLPDLPMVAVTPTFLHPEVAPYLRSGQLAGLLGTVRDGATYAIGSMHVTRTAGPGGLLVGLLVALAFIGRAAWGLRGPGPIGPGQDTEEDE
jgi:hypothetical protein